MPYPARNVTVVNNGSTDATAALAIGAGTHVVHVSRRGYGRACLAGIQANPDAELFVFLDADLSERPEAMQRLVEPILQGEADLVLGARGGQGRPWHARIGTSLCVWAINSLWSTRYSDLGPFRAIRATSLHALDMRDQTWGWTIEMQDKAVEADLRAIEVVVTSGPRLAGRSEISGSFVGSIRAGARMCKSLRACMSQSTAVRTALEPWRRPASEHVLHIRRSRRIREEGRFELRGRQPGAHGEREQINHFAGMRPEQVRAEDALGSPFDDRFICGRLLAEPSRRVPAGHVASVDVDVEAIAPRIGFVHTDRRHRRNREHDRGDGGVIGVL